MEPKEKKILKYSLLFCVVVIKKEINNLEIKK